VVAIESLLTRADRTAAAGRLEGGGGGAPRSFQSGALTEYEASPMELSEVGELIFRVQRLRRDSALWLRGKLRTELLQGAQELLDSGRLTAPQRAWVAQSLLRRLETINAFNAWVHHW
jgi:hypothetical protein